MDEKRLQAARAAWEESAGAEHFADRIAAVVDAVHGYNVAQRMAAREDRAYLCSVCGGPVDIHCRLWECPHRVNVGPRVQQTVWDNQRSRSIELPTPTADLALAERCGCSPPVAGRPDDTPRCSQCPYRQSPAPEPWLEDCEQAGLGAWWRCCPGAKGSDSEQFKEIARAVVRAFLRHPSQLEPSEQEVEEAANVFLRAPPKEDVHAAMPRALRAAARVRAGL